MPPSRPPTATPSGLPLPSLAADARWLRAFAPPFAFGDFFSPEDTVLCALATRAALRRARRAGDVAADAAPCVVELTAGSALVLAAALRTDPALRGAGAEVDGEAVARARRNLQGLGLDDRATVERRGLFDSRLTGWLQARRPRVLACNPPYVPEPPGAPLALCAGAGPRGDRHPRRVLRVAAAAAVPRVVLSWCSLGDPVAVMRTAARHGYRLERLWAAAVCDGEWTGLVHDYLRTLPTSYLAEDAATLAALAPDGGARFAYLLLAGSFVRAPSADDAPRRRRGVRRVARLVRAVGDGGLDAFARAARRRGIRAYAVTRADELRLRIAAHG